MSATAIREEPLCEATMTALIIYDEIALAKQAKAMLERADATTRWDVKPWRVDLLTAQGMGKAALNDAADAHLIVFAVHQAQSLPAWLVDWLEQWATRRQVFDGGNGDTLSRTAAPELSQFAERQGLSFVFGDVGPTEEASTLLVQSLHERAAAQTATLLGILEQSRHGYEHWGINE